MFEEICPSSNSFTRTFYLPDNRTNENKWGFLSFCSFSLLHTLPRGLNTWSLFPAAQRQGTDLAQVTHKTWRWHIIHVSFSPGQQLVWKSLSTASLLWYFPREDIDRVRNGAAKSSCCQKMYFATWLRIFLIFCLQHSEGQHYHQKMNVVF